MPFYRGFGQGPPATPPTAAEGPTRRIDRTVSPSLPVITHKPLDGEGHTRRIDREERDPSHTDRSPPPIVPTSTVTRRVDRQQESAIRARLSAQAARHIPERRAPTRPSDDLIVGWLVVIAGIGRGTVLPMGYGVNDIGHGANVRVPLPIDAQVTDNPVPDHVIHAAVIYTARNRQFYAQSVAAETQLNGAQLRESTALHRGDVLQVGETQLRFIPLCGEDFDWRSDN